MMDNPLTRQIRPDHFEQKIVELYRQLFHVPSYDDLEETTPTEGFWTELFLLKPDKQKLYNVLEPLTAENLLQIQTQTRLFFRRAIEEASSGVLPRNENALDNLTAFLCAVLTKRFTNPSTDVIEVLAGLDDIDSMVSDLVQGIESIVRQGDNLPLRRKAVFTALATVAGSYQTSLVTYFVHRDLFPALMKLAKDASKPVPEVLVLLGLLANYNKFESQNLYHHRLEDFVNATTISQLIDVFSHTSKTIRDQYVLVLDDSPIPWTISSTLSMVGLRSLTPDGKNKPIPPTEEEAKAMFANLPSADASIFLAAYSFVDANQIFASQLLSTTQIGKDDESNLAVFLSTSSYLCHHAHRTARSLAYATLTFLIFRLLSEDKVLMKRLCSPENKISIRLARQRPPLLPLIDKPRIPITAILDICSDTITHNLRKRLSVPLYSAVLSTLVRVITHLESTKTRLQHHWSQTWGSIFSLLRFLTQYQSDLAATSSAYMIRDEICTPLTSLLAFSLSRGDNFLPDPSSYDDLFYKLIEASAVLPRFKALYCSKSSTALQYIGPQTDCQTMLSLATNALLSVTSHYENLLTSKSKSHQSPATVQKIIREGYETLPDIGSSPISTIPNGPTTIKVVDFGHWEKWREAAWKSEIKRILRTVVEDARLFCLTSK